MASQSILWTTLPYGRITLADGSPALRVSIFVAPRLTPDADETLAFFDLFHNWPKTVKQLRFKLRFGSGESGELVPLPGEDPLDEALWGRLFDRRTFVRGYKFLDLRNENIRSFPAALTLLYLQSLYGQTAAKHGDEFPAHGPEDDTPLRKLKEDLGRINDLGHRGALDKKLGVILREGKTVPKVPAGFASVAEAVFFQASRFYDRKKREGANNYSEHPDPKLKPVAVKKPEFDFHQALTAFGDYPRLMRRLGLVIDCAWKETVEVPRDGRVSIAVSSPVGSIQAWIAGDKPAWTHYVLSASKGDSFRAVAKAGVQDDLTRGELNLKMVADAAPTLDAAYTISQLDVDGSALKTINTADSLARLDDQRLTNFRSPKRSDLPALRTLGLSLFRSDRAKERHAHLVRAADLQTTIHNGGVADFFADDLLRGYRLDVWDDVSKAWHPLCRRNGQYFLTKRGAPMEVALTDEGYVKSASVSRGDASVETDLYLHERLLAFDGWSLVAPRPGKTLAADPAVTEPVEAPLSAETEYGLMTRFSPPPGTLPRLRFGRKYRMRVRLVDLAGNGISFEEANDNHASQPFHYTRFEPVPSPTLLSRARVTEGESLEHLVIRSDYNRSATAYAADPAVTAILARVHARLNLSAAARADYIYREVNERHVAPPKTSQLEAEVHGLFDAYIGPGKDPAPGYHLATREAGTFLAKTWINRTTGKEEPIPDVELEVVTPYGVTPTNLDDPKRKPGDALGEGEYVIHKEEQLTVPYLPDPFAVGVVFVGLPGWPANAPYVVAFDGKWPDPLPFRIRLAEREADASKATAIPDWNKAERVLTVFQPKAAVSEVRYSCLMPKGAEKLMSLWKWLEQRGGLNSDVTKKILNGGHWMFTPWRTMKLAHAVQHPLLPPLILKWGESRGLGETFTRLSGFWHLSASSTAKVVVQANWQEPLDDVTRPTWQLLERSSNVVDFMIEPTQDDKFEVPTARERIRGEYFDHQFGDTKHRMIKYQLKGTTRFREYFPPELTQDEAAITRTGNAVALDIPSSARPAAPQPLYVLPTFRWEETALSGNGLSRTRKGNGLRVYLDRPWWSSGENELLGVLFRPGQVADADKSFVTQWGLDPVFASTAPLAGPNGTSFPLATEVRANLSLEEKGKDVEVYSVAGHAVEFDPVRKLWFADIEVKAGGSYFPFIRLALARFQPSSLLDCHLSRVVQTDFMQLVPDRTLNLKWLGSTRATIEIRGQAPTETTVSKILEQWGITTTPAEARSATTPVRDLIDAPVVGVKALENFKLGQMEYLQAGEWQAAPGTLTPVGDPVAASSKAGLNEYSVTLEWLPEDASPDFGWEVIATLQATMPPGPTSSPAKRPDVDIVLENRSGTTKATDKRAVAKSATNASKTAKPAVGKGKTTADVEGTIGQVDVNPGPTIKPLWEGEITLPAAHANRPRRLVIREHELYFRTFILPDNIFPVVRRLVYVDIVNLG